MLLQNHIKLIQMLIICHNMLVKTSCLHTEISIGYIKLLTLLAYFLLQLYLLLFFSIHFIVTI